VRRRFEDCGELRIAAPATSAKLRAVPETIEAEVLEINGGPPPQPEPAGAERSARRWDAMRGKVVRLDRRWWPLWLLLGLVLGLVFLVVGLFVAALWLLGRVVGGVLRLFGGGADSSGGGLSQRGG
jgi:hypothetical protein